METAAVIGILAAIAVVALAAAFHQREREVARFKKDVLHRSAIWTRADRKARCRQALKHYDRLPGTLEMVFSFRPLKPWCWFTEAEMRELGYW